MNIGILQNMAVSIVTLITGEKLICGLKELYEGDEENKRGLCLLAENPYVLSLIKSTSSDFDTDDELKVKFSKWNPYSSDNQFRLPYSSVMTVSNPDSGLKEAYLNKISTIINNGNNSEPTETGE